MTRFQSLTKWATLLVVLLAGLLVLGAVLGQPIGLSYVESGSMEPALNTNDGFISVPHALAGEISRGDVVVFDAEFLHDGGLVTHRVVDETSRKVTQTRSRTSRLTSPPFQTRKSSPSLFR